MIGWLSICIQCNCRVSEEKRRSEVHSWVCLQEAGGVAGTSYAYSNLNGKDGGSGLVGMDGRRLIC